MKVTKIFALILTVFSIWILLPSTAALSAETSYMSSLNSLSQLVSNSFDAFFRDAPLFEVNNTFQINISIQQSQNQIPANRHSRQAFENLKAAHQEAENGRYKRAISLYTSALEEDKQLLDAYTGRALLYADMERYEAAIDSFENAIKINEDFIEGYLGIGAIYNKQGEPEKAIEYFQKSIKVNPNYYRAWIDLGSSFMQTHQYDEAIKNFRRANILKPDKVKPHIFLAKAFIETSNYRNALEVLEDAPLNESTSDEIISNIYYLKGIANRENDNIEESIICFNKSIEYSHQNFDTFYQRGIAYFEGAGYYLGNYKEYYNKAASDFEKFLEVYPDSQEALDYLREAELSKATCDGFGNALSSVYEQNYPDREKEYTKVISINHLDKCTLYSLFNRGLLRLEHLNKYESAIKDFREFEESFPEPDKYSAFHIGRAYIKLGDFDRALINLNRSLEIDPEYADAYNERNNLYKILNRKQGQEMP